MNVEEPNPPVTQTSVSVNAESPRTDRPGARVEPCEFENLLRRAMEILDTRARMAASSGQ